MLSASAKRVVVCGDAITWLRDQQVLLGCSLVSSLPDYSEFPRLSLETWKAWFRETAKLILERCPDDGAAIFYQSDIKRDGTWVDKSYLVQAAAENTGHQLLWHKIVCRKPAGTTTYGRPAYSHLLCFSRGLRADVSRSTPDLLPTPGPSTWTRGMGLEAALTACRYIQEQTTSRTVVNPFCGHGTVLAAANALGLNAIGIELSPKRAKKARNLAANELNAESSS